jgi:hypothetical protein
VKKQKKNRGVSARLSLFLALIFLIAMSVAASQKQKSLSPKTGSSLAATKKAGRQDDSSNSKPAADLALRLEGAHKADALTHFVE